MATAHQIDSTKPVEREERRFNTGGILLGIGFGGFVDGIVLHQMLQWHHMLTSTGDHPATTIAGLETNTLWDGLFPVSNRLGHLRPRRRHSLDHHIVTIHHVIALKRRGRQETRQNLSPTAASV